MRDWRNKGVEYIEFWDETFNPNKKRLEVFAEAMERADLGLQWAIRGAVVQHVVPETMARLERTGLRIIQFGVESFSKKTLAFLNKRIDREMVFPRVRDVPPYWRAHRREHDSQHSGQPSRTSRRTEVPPHCVRPCISIYNWAPGTHHYQQALDSGQLARDRWRARGNPIGQIRHPSGQRLRGARLCAPRSVRARSLLQSAVRVGLPPDDRSVGDQAALSTSFLMAKGILKDNLDLSLLRAVRG